MNGETWLEKAERLRGELDRISSRQLEDEDRVVAQRLTIAVWLRSEFSEGMAPSEFHPGAET